MKLHTPTIPQILNWNNLNSFFADEDNCIIFLEGIRWPESIISPFDENSTVYKATGNRYKCRNTNRYFNVKTGTFFEKSKIPLSIWFAAIYLFLLSNKTISSLQLSKELEITQRTSSFILIRIKHLSPFIFSKRLNDFELVIRKILSYKNDVLKAW